MRRTVARVVVCRVAVFVFGVSALVGFVGLAAIVFAESPGWGFLALFFVGVFGLSYPRLFDYAEGEK